MRAAYSYPSIVKSLNLTAHQTRDHQLAVLAVLLESIAMRSLALDQDISAQGRSLIVSGVSSGAMAMWCEVLILSLQRGVQPTSIHNELAYLYGLKQDLDVVYVRYARSLHDTYMVSKRAAINLNVLSKLEQICASHPQKEYVAELYATILFNTLNDSAEVGNLSVASKRLQSIVDLHKIHPGNVYIRDRLAGSLYNSINNMRWAGKPSDFLMLLNRLRDLVRVWPEDVNVSFRLSRALNNYYVNLPADANQSLIEGIREEMRRLADAWPIDSPVQAMLSVADPSIESSSASQASD